MMVNILPNVEITAIPNDTACTSETIILDAGNPGLSYLWSTDETTQSIEVSNISGPSGGSQAYWVIVTNNNNCQATDDIVIYFDPCLGFLETINYKIEIYPNPTERTFTITISGINGSFDYLLVNLLGKIMLMGNANLKFGKYTNEFDLTSYPNGIYLLKVQNINNGFLKIKKIIKN